MRRGLKASKSHRLSTRLATILAWWSSQKSGRNWPLNNRQIQKKGWLNYAKGGYTIVEVMIVLAVSSAILVGVLTSVSGQQHKTEFSQAINDIDAKIRQVISNVGNGYYENSGNFSCSAPGNAGPQLTPGTNNQGANQDCIFIGRAMQFAVGGDASAYNIYNVIGQRQKNATDNATTLAETKPIAMAPPNTGATQDMVESGSLLYGLSAAKMYYTHPVGGSPSPVSAVSFISTFPQLGQQSSSQTVQLIPIQNTSNIGNPSADKSQNATVNQIKAANMTLVPDDGVTICFKSGGTDQYGIIRIGVQNSQLTTNVLIQTSAQATDPVSGLCR